MNAPRAPARASGFTLIEVIVALALLTVLVSVVYGGFTTAVRAYDAAGERGDASARMRVISDWLRRSLGSAFPLAIAGDSDWRLVFEGERDRLRYVADLPTWVGIGGLHEVGLEIVSDGGEQNLVMRRRPLAVDARGDLVGEFEDHVLLEDVSTLEVRYFGSEDARGQATWREAWPAGRTMPLLVELRVTTADGGPWPAILARPRVDTVRYQSVSGRESEPPPGDASPPIAPPQPDAPENER